MKKIISLVCFFSAVNAFAARPAKPNIVLLLTDDLGWQDVKCYDIDEPSPMETPNIDSLAKKGVMFWQAYSPAPTCAPSRCAIMSGNHPARAQKTHVVGGAPPHPHHKLYWSMIAPCIADVCRKMNLPWQRYSRKMATLQAIAANGTWQ